MAAARAFGTVELLELILDELDERTLLLSQRINKTFAATITDSSKYQRKLFFTDEPPYLPWPGFEGKSMRWISTVYTMHALT